MLSQQAKSADSFVDTIGVNVHLHYTNTVYKEFNSLIKPRLLELGVRHLRDGAATYSGINRDSFFYERVRELANEGFQFNFITSSLKTEWGEPTDYSLLDEVYEWSDGAIASFEAVNEPDIQGVDSWLADTRLGQKELYSTVNSDPDLKDIPVIGSSVIHSKNKSAVGNLSKWKDYGNLRNYFDGRHPETNGWGSNGYGSLDWHFREAEKLSGSDPVISTETGWSNVVDTNGNHLGVPEDIEAKYVPRLFLNHFNAGVDRTYLYELIDLQDRPGHRDSNFGLLNNDGSREPSFKALRNLIDLLEDPGSSFTPESLKFSLEGNTSDVEHTLLQKSDGSFYLALWLGKSSWDPNAKRRIDVPGQSVTLALPDAFENATLHQFKTDGSVKESASKIADGQMNLTVRDTVTIIELPSQGASSTQNSSSGQKPVTTDDTQSASPKNLKSIAEPVVAADPQPVDSKSSGNEETLVSAMSIDNRMDVVQAKGDGLKATYYDDRNFQNPVFSRTDATIDFDWGSSSPDASISPNTFSVEWTGYIAPETSGTHTFKTTSDDGVRLWIGDQLLIDKWNDQAATSHTGEIELEANQLYPIRMMYYENQGSAEARLAWSSTSQNLTSDAGSVWSSTSQNFEVVPQDRLFSSRIGGNGLNATYYNDREFQNPVLTRMDAAINFDWGSRSPHAAVNSNEFSVRWSGYVSPEYSEEYTFRTTSDDGVRLWVNDQLVIDRWADQAARSHTGTISLEADQFYSIRMEYYENQGLAEAGLSWSSASQDLEIVPQNHLYTDIGADVGSPM